MRRMVWLLALACAAWGGPVFHEPWLGAMELEEGWAAWGRTHVWWSGGVEGRENEQGLPAGVVALLPDGAGLWAAQADGCLRRLEPGPSLVWQAGRSCRAGLAEGAGIAWQLLDGEIWRIALRGGASPEGLGHWPLPAAGPPWELKRLDGSTWMRTGSALCRLSAEGPLPVAHLPLKWRDWLVWADALLVLDEEGGLHWLDSWQGRARPHCRVEAPPPGGRWRALAAGRDLLWLQAEDSSWWRWTPGTAPALVEMTLPGASAGWWLPAGDDLLLHQDSRRRSWWALDEAVWQVRREQVRPPALADRLLRWSGEWRLARDGRLSLHGPAGEQELERFPGAHRLAPAGAGPVLLTEAGLVAFGEDGRRLGDWTGGPCLAAAALEDHLLVAGDHRLRVFWTGEETPLLQGELELPEAAQVSASSSWAAVHGEGLLWLVELDPPWAPRRVGARPLPPGTRDFLLVEDRLLIGGDEGLAAWQASEAGWTTLPPLPIAGPVSALCRRGADRLLVGDDAGRLGQWRLVANLPLALEWEESLPLAGRMAVARDSLRVLGETGWLDHPLPALAADAPACPAPGHPAQTFPFTVRRQGEALLVSWEASGGPVARVRLYDLLGRLVREGAALTGASRLELPGLPAGCYLLEAVDAEGRRGVQILAWRPR
ncbi:MAG: hypothetical protein Q8O14_02550 [bacterium]|nr:hypothetical protein [bacterium]